MVTEPARPGLYGAAAFTLLGLVASALMAGLSDGVHQDDDLTHLQMARWIWDHPRYLLDEWGRPGFTALYAPAARIGWPAARLFSGLLTALTGWLAYLIAARQQIRLAGCVPLLFWLQPLTFTLSYTTLTETALALYLTLSMWLYLRGRYGWSAATISLAAVTRHEAALLLAVWLVALLHRRRPWREYIWLIWAPLLQNALSAIFLHETPLRLFIDAAPTDEYGHGSWLSMLVRWPVAAGIGPLLLAWAGLPWVFRRPGGRLWVTSGLAYFVAHTLIFRYGLFASGGYFRFLVPLGPLVAVAAAETLSQVWAALRAPPGSAADPARPPDHQRLLWLFPVGVLLLWLAGEVEIARYRDILVQLQLAWTGPALRGVMAALGGISLAALALMRSRSPRLPMAVLSLFPATMLILAAAQPAICAALPPPLRLCGPLVLTGRERAYREAVSWLRENGLSQRRVVAASPWFDEFLGRERPPRAPLAGTLVAAMRPGDVLLWDSREFASRRHGLTFADAQGRADFAELWVSGGGPLDDVYCAIFEKRVPGDTRPADER